MRILRNARVLPEPGTTGEWRTVDLLLAGGRIQAMERGLRVSGCPAEETDLEGRVTAPGLVDGHVHFTGATWDEGYTSKTPEIFLSHFLRAGITTAVGLLGMGYGCEDLKALAYKVLALRDEGLGAYMHTGNFRFPAPSILGSPGEDVVFLPYVLGCKVALTDRFSSHPSLEEFCRLSSEVYVAGLQSGKPGLMHLHVAEYGDPFAFLEEAHRRSGVPLDRSLPTHCNTNADLLEQARGYALRGGNVDLSTILEPDRGCLVSVKASKAVEQLVAGGVAPERITLSSDGNVGLPLRDGQGTYLGLYLERTDSLLENLQALLRGGFPPETAFALTGANPAKRLGLYPRKGALRVGADADLAVFGENWELERVYLAGEPALEEGRPCRFSYFERDLRDDGKEEGSCSR